MAKNTIVVPKKYTRSRSDYVSFTAREHETGEKFSHSKQPCYHGYTYGGRANKFDYFCRPSYKSTLPSRTYVSWMRLCKKHGLLLPDTVVKTSDGKNSCHILTKGASKHCIFASLCCYRWADSTPAIPWTVVQLVQKRRVSFYQALHVALARYVTNINHSICSISPFGDNIRTYISNTNILSSLAIRHFYRRDKGDKSRADQCKDSTILSAISSTVIKWGFSLPEIPAFSLPTLEDVLCKDWKKLYDDDEPLTKEKIVAYHSRVMEKRKLI